MHKNTWVPMFIAEFLQVFAKTLPPPSAFFKRMALISHGRELVNGPDLYGEKLDGQGTRLVRAGIQSLRAAGAAEGDIDLDILKENGEEWIWRDFLILFSGA